METPEQDPAQPHEHAPELDRELDRELERELADSLALAIHLNAKRLPKRRKGVAITYDAYDWLAKAVIEQLKLARWRFWRKPQGDNVIRGHKPQR